MIDVLNEDLQKKQEELRELKKECIQIDADNTGLKKQQEALEQEIQNLTSRLDNIKRWKRSDFVMINPNSFAVGFLQLDNGSFQIVQKAEGQSQQEAVRWARKAGRPLIDQDQELTRNIYASFAPGDIISGSKADEIKRYWRPARFVPFAPEEANPPFVVFRDADSGRRHLGFYLGNDAQELKVREVASTDDAIARSRIQIGSVRQANGDKILPSLCETEFLDFCTLRAAQQLGSKENKPSLVRLAVHVEVEALREEIELSKVMDTRAADEAFEFWARLHEKPYPRDARKEPVRILREIAMYLEDRLHDKLGKVGVPLLERQQMPIVQEEGKFGRYSPPLRQNELTQLGATHLLLVDVKKAGEGGKFHMAMRLTSVWDGSVIWSISGEHLLPQPDIQHKFLLQTGRVAVVTLKKNSKEEFRGIEQPAVAVPAFMGMTSNRVHLVVLEDSTDEDQIVYRPLFSEEVSTFPRKEVDSLLMVTKEEQVPTIHQIRYAVWKMASKILPTAGKATRVENDRAMISLGLNHGVKNHDTLYVLRNVNSQPQMGDSAASSRVLLATTLNVTEIHNDRSRVVISGSGLKGWDDDEGLLPNDLVITRTGNPISIAMLAPDWRDPAGKAIDRLGLRNPVKLRNVLNSTNEMSRNVKEALGAGLRELGIPVYTEVSRETIQMTTASHIFSG